MTGFLVFLHMRPIVCERVNILDRFGDGFCQADNHGCALCGDFI